MRRIFALIAVLACFRSAAQSNLERYLQTALLNLVYKTLNQPDQQ